MAIDVKAEITKIVEKISKDEALKKDFQKDPVGAAKKMLGVQVSDDVIQQVVAGIKGKLTADQLSGAVDSIKKLF